MAGKSASEVRVGVDGKVLVAPLATTAPTGISSTWTGSADLGYVSEDGITETNSTDVEQIKAWQNAAVVRTVVTGGETTFKFTLIQTSADTLKEYYGITTGDITSGAFVTRPTKERPHKSYVIDIVDGTNLVRKYVKDGQITEVGDIVYANGEPIGFEVTLTAYDDATLGGSVKHWYTEIATP